MKEYDPETHICFSSVDGFYFVFKGYDIGIERMLDILAKVNMHDYGLDYLLSAIKPSLIKHGIDFSTIISEDIKNAIYDAGFKIEDLRAYEKQRIIFIERVYRIMKKKETNRFRNKILRFATLEARESRHTMSEFLYNLETLYMLFEQTRSTKRRKYLEENASLDETNELDKIYEWFYNLKYNLKAFEQHISNFVGVQLIPPYRSHEETVKLLLQLARNKEIKFASKESLLYHVLKHGDAAIDLFNKSAFLQNWAKKWRLYTTRANNAIAEHQMVQSHWEAIGGGRTFIFYLPNKRVTAMAVVFVSEYGEVFLKTYYTIAGTNKDRLGNMPSHHVEILLEKVEDSSLYLPVMQFISEVIDETVLLSEEQSSTSDYGSMSDISSLQDTTDFNDSELDIDDLMDTNRLEMKHSLGKHKNFAELIFSSDKPDSAIKISQYWLTYPLELEDFEDVRILTENAAVIFKEVLHKPSSNTNHSFELTPFPINVPSMGSCNRVDKMSCMANSTVSQPTGKSNDSVVSSPLI
uniref:Uncharacterized protein n=2 Tax=Acrobeloides nanus TaxID=290746 RepID=A0A914C865_9BILA